ncbi:MAG: hypothetical protein ACUVSK_06525 [Desulfotomaculales bacterium]
MKYDDVPLADVPDPYCWLCAGETGGKGQPVSRVIKPTFTDAGYAKNPSSKSLCAGCVFCLSHYWLRNYNLLATEDCLMHPRRSDLKKILLRPPRPPFLMCITVSGQKHLHFKGRISYATDFYPVLFEEIPVIVNRKALAGCLEFIEELLSVFTKQEVLTGRYSQNRIKEFGRKNFEAIEDKIAPFRRKRIFNLAVFVAQVIPR